MRASIQSFQDMNRYVSQATQKGHNQELLAGIKDSLQLGVQNQEDIKALRRELNTKIGSIKTEIGQFQVKQDLAIHQNVRAEMYEQIKQNNVSITKRIEEQKALLKRQLSKNEEDV